MVRQTLWAEITICGFVFLSGLFFTILSIFQIQNISFLKEIEPYTALVSVILIIFSYFIGFIAHRSIHLLGKIKCLKWLRGGEKKRKRFPDDLRKKIKIINHGNERFLLELDYQFNHKVVSQLILYGFPFLLISFSFWLFLVSRYDLMSFSIFFCVTLFIIYWLCRIKNLQKHEYSRLLDLIYNEIINKSNSNQSQPSNKAIQADG